MNASKPGIGLPLPPTRKALGQHWLHDTASLEAMLAAAMVGPQDTVLEIGPGPGTLTNMLVATAHQVVAVELDQQLAADLPQRVPAGNLSVIQADILRFDLRQLPAGYKVVANIPYYLTSNALRLLCQAPQPFSQAALLTQKEVAQRVCAVPGDMSLLSVSVQYYCQASLGRLVPAALFTPPPKVDSQILVLHYRQAPLFTDVDERRFFQLVRAGFSQRRKTLANALAGGLQLPRTNIEELLRTADLAPNVRAQELSLQQWHELYQAWQASSE